MKTKFTEGKWIIDGSQIVTGINPTDETICDINPETEYPAVYARNKNEAYSNAKLIASAPKLLHELNHLVRLLEPLEQNGELDVPGLATLNGARIAIKEATE